MKKVERSPEITEKKETPWRVKFTCGKQQPTYAEARKDLLNACWGNEKMADALYHFIHAGSWKAYNTQVDASVRTIVLQESHADILTKVKVSEPTLITFLKLFAQAGYVNKASYKKAQAVNFEKIEQAFINPPEKPTLGTNLSLNLSLKKEQSKEVERLSLEVEKLTSQVQDLSLTLESFKCWYAQIEHEFKLNLSVDTKTFKFKNSSESTPEAAADSENFSKNLSLDKKIEEERVIDNCDCALAPSQPATNQTLSNHSYSQKPQQATLPGSDGYEKPIDVETPPSKKSRRKVKSEQLPEIAEKPAMPPEDAPWSPATIRGMFNHWRGHAPLTQGTAVQQNNAANALYQANYTRDQITKVYERMCKQQYWIDKGGVEIWNVANCIAREIKLISKILPFQKPGTNAEGVDVYSISYQAERTRLRDVERNRKRRQMLLENGCDPEQPETPLEELLAELEEEYTLLQEIAN